MPLVFQIESAFWRLLVTSWWIYVLLDNLLRIPFHNCTIWFNWTRGENMRLIFNINSLARLLLLRWTRGKNLLLNRLFLLGFNSIISRCYLNILLSNICSEGLVSQSLQCTICYAYWLCLKSWSFFSFVCDTFIYKDSLITLCIGTLKKQDEGYLRINAKKDRKKDRYLPQSFHPESQVFHFLQPLDTDSKF